MKRLTNFKNCKITFRLSTPICFTFPWFQFDGIIAHLQNRKHDPTAYRHLDTKKVDRTHKDIPTVIKSRNGIAHASSSIIDEFPPSYATIYSKFHDSQLFRMREQNKLKMENGFRIQLGSGHYRSYMIKLVIIPVKEASFYACCVPDLLKELIQGLPSIGKKSSIGYGSIRDYSIIEIDNDYSIVSHNGKAQRPIPTRYLDEYDDVAWMAYRAPYWRNEIDTCAPPGANVKYKSRTERDRIFRKLTNARS